MLGLEFGGLTERDVRDWRRGIAMGMNELGPRRCPFVFVSVILEKRDIMIKMKESHDPEALT